MSQYGAPEAGAAYGQQPGAQAGAGAYGAYGQQPAQGYGQESQQLPQAGGFNQQQPGQEMANGQPGMESQQPSQQEPNNQLANSQPGAAGGGNPLGGLAGALSSASQNKTAVPVGQKTAPNHAHSRFTQDPHHHSVMQHYHKVASHGMTASHIESFVHLGTLGLAMLAHNSGMTAGHEPEEAQK